MLKFTINGKPAGLEQMGDELMKAAVVAVSQQMRERLEAIRHPDTGEFLSVVPRGENFDELSFVVEGSPALLDIVRAHLSLDEQSKLQFVATERGSSPKAFLSFGWEDRELAQKIAERLQANGIETWWAEWEIRSGDSIRQRIDQGLGQCTHFIVLLTPHSINRPWVNEEIDAAFFRKVEAKCQFIPLRHGVAPSELSPLLAGMRSPDIDADLTGIDQLINDIHGISTKPLLGPPPLAAGTRPTGYTAAATALARVFVEKSESGLFTDTQLTIEELMTETGLTVEDVTDAIHELRHCLTESWDRVMARDCLYSEFDCYWKPWRPAEDALRLAADLVNDPELPSDTSLLAQRYQWPARRLNPAITYLAERNAIGTSDALGSWPFTTIRVLGTDATRRFVKSRR